MRPLCLHNICSHTSIIVLMLLGTILWIMAIFNLLANSKCMTKIQAIYKKKSVWIVTNKNLLRLFF